MTDSGSSESAKPTAGRCDGSGEIVCHGEGQSWNAKCPGCAKCQPPAGGEGLTCEVCGAPLSWGPHVGVCEPCWKDRPRPAPAGEREDVEAMARKLFTAYWEPLARRYDGKWPTWDQLAVEPKTMWLAVARAARKP